MGDGSIIDIVLFAMVAAFLFFRLRSVLGRRTGQERQRPNPFIRRAPDQRPDAGAPRPGPRAVVQPLPRAELPHAPPSVSGPAPLAAGLAAIKQADPAFDEVGFLNGARVAFEMIVAAYARGDLTALRPLLSDDVFEQFSGAVGARQSAGETLETTLSGIRILDIIEARVEGRVAIVTIKAVSDQVNLLRDRAGAVLDGDPAKPVEVVDLWTFSRDTRARDPNWTLIATRTPN